ncbi:acyltransferase [Oryzibacter oryziterrae]|uniref:acyltransferase n=1 Tax=Oryzibacter oryziterrae TaxID=2766474 RepID=UPI00272C71C6|nr:DapH/DapD/GlmU-related protein [Oryzibacter oryziterrae]
MLGILKRFVAMYQKHRDPVRYARKLGVTIGKDCRLLGADFSTEPYLVTLGDHVSATKVQFLTHDGSVWVFRDEEPEIDLVRPIRVGNNVFIGFGAIVLPGVTIGDNVVIGAGSVVAKDIPSNCVAAGVPAKVIRSLEEYKSKTMKNVDRTKSLSESAKREHYIRKFGRASD